MKITVIGTGYVGLVSGVCLADIGHEVTCLDIDHHKINQLNEGVSPIYEPGLEDLLKKNLDSKRLRFTYDIKKGMEATEIIIIAVGTPSNKDGTVNLSFIENVAVDIGQNLTHEAVVVTKSTVPVGTNERIHQIIKENLTLTHDVHVVSCPEFLREGSAIYDTFHGERIVIGAENKDAAQKVEEAFKPFNIPVLHTDTRSAEMIKYASNAFLATKISFINEIANLCEKVGANVEDVALGMGKDSRIGEKFLNAGIGYGGSCFPKDTNGLYQIANQSGYEFKIIESVIEVNTNQQLILLDKLIRYYGTLELKTIAILGLAFKPNTNDIREAASLKVLDKLLELNCNIRAYDPIAADNVRELIKSNKITYCDTYQDALNEADCALILTEWKEFKEMDLAEARKLLKHPIIFDGRNCFALEVVRKEGFNYFSVGRPDVRLNEKDTEELLP